MCVFGKVYCPVELNAAQSVCMLHTWVALFFFSFVFFRSRNYIPRKFLLSSVKLSSAHHSFNAIKLFSPLMVATALDDNVGHFSTNAVSTLSIVKINQPFILGKNSIIWFFIYIWVAACYFPQEFVFLLFWPLFCTIHFRKILLRRLACFGQVWKSNPCPNVLASESASMEKIFLKNATHEPSKNLLYVLSN